MIICVTGIPGSGKSTASRYLYDVLRDFNYPVVYFHTDFLRSRLFEEELATEGEKNRDFTPIELSVTYNSAFLLSQELSREDKNKILIIDGTFRDNASKIYLELVAQRSGHKCVFFHVVSCKKNRERRVVGRYESTGVSDVFDGNYEKLYGVNVYKISNSGSLELLKKNLDSSLKSNDLFEYNLD